MEGGVFFADKEPGGIEFDRQAEERCKKYLEERKLAISLDGDQIKYSEEGEIEWMFSPRYGWYELPEEKVEELTMHDLSWDYF
jgi:hypothetical protein